MGKLQKIRSFNTSVILLTRNNDYEYNNDHIMYGFKDYLLKPIDKDKLFEKLVSTQNSICRKFLE